jgi:hypothetical protein
LTSVSALPSVVVSAVAVTNKVSSPLLAGLDTERDREMVLAGADRTEQQQVVRRSECGSRLRVRGSAWHRLKVRT